MITSHDKGHLIIWDENLDDWIYADDKTIVRYNPRSCPRCGHMPTEEGYDYCLGKLPGVLNACCGHGVEEGYIQFENGIEIRGNIRVDNWE